MFYGHTATALPVVRSVSFLQHHPTIVGSVVFYGHTGTALPVVRSVSFLQHHPAIVGSVVFYGFITMNCR